CDKQQKAPNRSYEAANRNGFITGSTAPHLYSTFCGPGKMATFSDALSSTFTASYPHVDDERHQ
ncbi:MAG TPA: hypothetical protein VLR44_10200, partial [Rhodoferax sp.]|nr:hypothetical protein [Rhodoferax sp.]